MSTNYGFCKGEYFLSLRAFGVYYSGLLRGKRILFHFSGCCRYIFHNGLYSFGLVFTTVMTWL
jgi:hypothetical protein